MPGFQKYGPNLMIWHPKTLFNQADKPPSSSKTKERRKRKEKHLFDTYQDACHRNRFHLLAKLAVRILPSHPWTAL